MQIKIMSTKHGISAVDNLNTQLSKKKDGRHSKYYVQMNPMQLSTFAHTRILECLQFELIGTYGIPPPFTANNID